mmetsp:Transcript_44519/g.141855  ORF Transcript_44519/g.141855 Transcript_44519/m.141855 type:complete len:487 (-) Transcript_44519:566-2026(-)
MLKTYGSRAICLQIGSFRSSFLCLILSSAPFFHFSLVPCFFVRPFLGHSLLCSLCLLLLCRQHGFILFLSHSSSLLDLGLCPSSLLCLLLLQLLPELCIGRLFSRPLGSLLGSLCSFPLFLLHSLFGPLLLSLPPRLLLGFFALPLLLGSLCGTLLHFPLHVQPLQSSFFLCFCCGLCFFDPCCLFLLQLCLAPHILVRSLLSLRLKCQPLLILCPFPCLLLSLTLGLLLRCPCCFLCCCLLRLQLRGFISLLLCLFKRLALLLLLRLALGYLPLLLLCRQLGLVPRLLLGLLLGLEGCCLLALLLGLPPRLVRGLPLQRRLGLSPCTLLSPLLCQLRLPLLGLLRSLLLRLDQRLALCLGLCSLGFLLFLLRGLLILRHLTDVDYVLLSQAKRVWGLYRVKQLAFMRETGHVHEQTQAIAAHSHDDLQPCRPLLLQPKFTTLLVSHSQVDKARLHIGCTVCNTLKRAACFFAGCHLSATLRLCYF